MNKNRNKIYIGIFALFILGFAACEKLDALQDRGVVTEGAGIKVMQMSPNAPGFSIMIDTLRAVTALANTASGKDTGLVFGNVFPSLAGGYAIVPGGAHTVSAKVASTASIMRGYSLPNT